MPHGDAKGRAIIPRLVVSITLNMALFAGLLFGPAGTLAWWRAWVFLGVVLLATVATLIWLYPGHRDLLAERLKPPLQRGQPLADKVVLLLFLASYYGLIALVPLDVFRLHLLGRPGPAASALGLVLVLAGWLICALALRENAFAALVVRHQAERRQRVIDTGPYGVVRHPLYAGGLLFIFGMPLWLGSYVAAVAAVLPTAILAVRIQIEERLLRRELPGYETYTARVRYRLVPFVW